jgi:prohibitin 2
MYTAEQSITNRAAISVALLEELNVKLNEVGIYIEDINIIDFDFSDAYVSAIEAKQVAEQDLLRTKTEQEQQIVIAQAEAEKVRIAAEAQAQQRVIAAQAEAESITAIAQAQAQANQLLSESLTDEVIDYAAIEAWDGKLPSVTGGATPFVNIDDDRQASQQTSQQ